MIFLLLYIIYNRINIKSLVIQTDYIFIITILKFFLFFFGLSPFSFLNHQKSPKWDMTNHDAHGAHVGEEVSQS